MSEPARKIVAFEFAYTLAVVDRLDRDGEAEIVQAYPGVSDVLARLRALDTDLVVIEAGVDADRLKTWLARAGLVQFFEGRVYGGLESENEVLQRATSAVTRAAAAGADSEHATRSNVLVYVSHSRYRRWLARSLGWRPCPSVKLASRSLSDPTVCYAVAKLRLAEAESMSSLTPERLIQIHPIVPLKVESRLNEAHVHCFAHASTLAELIQAGLALDVEVPDVGDCDAYELVAGDLNEDQQLDLDRQLRETRHFARDGQLYSFVMPGDPDVQLPHPARAPHGHTTLLAPTFLKSPGLLGSAALDPKELTQAECDQIKLSLSSDDLRALHDPLCGRTPLPSGHTINHRGHREPDNQLVVEHLAEQLSKELADTESKLTWPYRDGAGYPLQNVHGRIQGSDSAAGVIILGAHLDSFSDPNIERCNLKSLRAPGADDDASGLAALLLSARVLRSLSQENPPRREIRFVCFNAEETGMSGSLRYTDCLVAQATPVAGMIQLDMIGWQGSLRPNTFEARGPGTDKDWENYTVLDARSEEIADVIATARCCVASHLGIVRSTSGAPDPLSRRSDHRHFYRTGYPACYVGECGVAETGSSDPGNPPKFNPAYHTACDVEIDAEFAAAITRVVVAAIWMMAKA